MKLAVCLALASCAFAGTAMQAQRTVTPGTRTLVLAHNAYPDHGKYEDRLDRAIASGTPFVVEEDLAWINGRSLLIHGSKNVSENDPTLESYFFPKVKPLMEKALQEGNKGNWPLITLYLDIKNDPPEHLAAINSVLDKYQPWLTTAVKGDDITKQAPLKLGPMMVLVEDKYNDDNKRKAFYDDVPAGGEIRVFGSVTKPAENPNHLPKQEYKESLVSVAPEQIATTPADNYHRWWGVDWLYIEKGGEHNSGSWGAQKEARLKRFISLGHKLGYLVSFYCLDGFTKSESQGWEDEYNFGSLDSVTPRWKAVIRAKADFISTDQYERVSEIIRTEHRHR